VDGFDSNYSVLRTHLSVTSLEGRPYLLAERAAEGEEGEELEGQIVG
jgi:hypothetical protein